MYYSSNCNCNCNYDCGCNTVPSSCPSTTNNITTTTTSPCDGEKCDEIYSCECVKYNGPDLSCYGIKDGTSLCNILDIIISNLPTCKSQIMCFTVTKIDDINLTQSCTTIPDGIWNNKSYYKIKFNNCTDLIGYVYWNSEGTGQWEFSNKLGGDIIYGVLPLPSSLPISGILPWVYANTPTEGDYIMNSSISGDCPTTTTSTTTTTTTSTTTTTTLPPCLCLEVNYNKKFGGPARQFEYLDCNGVQQTKFVSYNSIKKICARSITTPEIYNYCNVTTCSDVCTG